MTHCFVDLDGVLADFVGGMCRAHSRENPYELDKARGQFEMHPFWGMSEEDFWKPSHGAKFWAELDLMPDAYELIDYLRGVYDDRHIAILTTPSRDPLCTAGKVEWIYKHFGVFARSFIITPKKHMIAHPKALLIDDKDSNIEAFYRSGGFSFLVPRPWNSAHLRAGKPYLDSLSHMINRWRDAV